MNREERRKLKKGGKDIKVEPTFMLKPSDLANAATKGLGKNAIMHEIHQQCLQAEKNLALDLDTCVLWTLHVRYGWGVSKLKKFYQDLFNEHREMREFYEIDEPFPERLKLKEMGIDIEALYNELFERGGEYKD